MNKTNIRLVLYGVVMCSLVLLAPQAARALTVDDLYQQINARDDRIRRLESRLGRVEQLLQNLVRNGGAPPPGARSASGQPAPTQERLPAPPPPAESEISLSGARSALGQPAPTQGRPPAPTPPVEKEISLSEVPSGERPLLLDLPDLTKTKVSGFIVGSFSERNHVRSGQEIPSGPESSNFRFEKFSIGLTRRFASWLFASGALEIENERRLKEVVDGGLEIEEDIETSLDVFEVTAIAPLGNGLSLGLGKYNVPFGIEREDPPFNLQATNSLIFELGRPQKVTGFRSRYQFNPFFDLDLFAVNGWDRSNDNNRDKTYGGRFGITPFEGLNLGIGGFYGPEQEDDNAHGRWILDADVTYTDVPRLILNGEFLYGGEQDVLLDAEEGRIGSAQWRGFQVTGHYDFFNPWGLTLRYGLFSDRDGARSGLRQTLQSFTLSPTIHLSSLIRGLERVGTVPRTNHDISPVDLRLEYRYDLSNRDAFFGLEGDRHDSAHSFTLQLNAVF